MDIELDQLRDYSIQWRNWDIFGGGLKGGGQTFVWGAGRGGG